MAVFLFHSQHEADKAQRERLRTHLTSQRDLQLFNEVQPGEQQQTTLVQRVADARCVVILITVNLVNALQGELLAPVLAALRSAGKPMVPVLASPCAYETLDVFHGVQVLPRDRKPLSTRTDPDSACVEIIQAVREHLRLSPLPHPQRLEALPRVPLTIELQRDSTGLRVRYLLRHRAPTAWTSARPLPPLHQLQGSAIFDLLFPDPIQTIDLLCDAHQEAIGQTPTPTRARLRLRIVTEDPELATLPYQTLRHSDQPLCPRWTCEVSPSPEPLARPDLPPPAKVLMLALAGAASRDFQRAVEEKLAALGPSALRPTYYVVLHDPAKLQDTLVEQRPHLILVHGLGLAQGYDGLPFNVLGHAMQALPDRERPLALFLAGAVARGFDQAARALTPEVPLVLVARPEQAQYPMGQLLTAWLGRFLGEGVEPVQALHDVWPAAAAPVAVFAAYNAFDYRPPELPSSARLPAAALKLERDVSRAVFDKRVWELQESTQRRVDLALAYAAPGNLLERFGAQAAEHVQRSRDAGILHRVHRRLPAQRTAATLARDLRTFVGCADHQTLTSALLSLLPKDGARVLLLDYGVCGECPQDDHSAPLLAADLPELLRFCRDHLAPACPDDLRVMLYLAVEVPAEHQRVFLQQVEEIIADADADWALSERFQCYPLPPLEAVTRQHLFKFLTNHELSNCPSALAPRAARCIYQASQGVYAEAVKLIEEALVTTYEQVLERLAGPPRLDGERKLGGA